MPASPIRMSTLALVAAAVMASRPIPAEPIHFTSLDFRTPLHGLVAGSGGALLRTMDGGATWTRARNLPSPSPDFGAVVLVDAGTAYAAGAGGTLLKSVDGGATWTALSSGTQRDLHCLAFPSPSLGFAGGDSGTLLRTRDAGASWAPVAAGHAMHILRFQFLDTSIGFALAADGLFRTTDGGETWQSLIPQSPVVDPAAEWRHVRMFFRDAQTGWYWRIQAKYFLPSNPHYGSLFINRVTRTIDGGATWAIQDVRIMPFQINADGNGFGWREDSLVVSRDGGATWKVAGPQPPGTTAVRFTDGSTGFAAGRYGCLHKTTDGGASWAALTGAVPDCAPADPIPDAVAAFPAASTSFRATLHGNLLRYVLPRDSRVSVRLLDTRGREAGRLFDRRIPAGPAEFRLPENVCGGSVCVLELRVDGIRRAFPVAPSRP